MVSVTICYCPFLFTIVGARLKHFVFFAYIVEIDWSPSNLDIVLVSFGSETDASAFFSNETHVLRKAHLARLSQKKREGERSWKVFEDMEVINRLESSGLHIEAVDLFRHTFMLKEVRRQGVARTKTAQQSEVCTQASPRSRRSARALDESDKYPQH